jgi:PAS domain S-box-containing protein
MSDTLLKKNKNVKLPNLGIFESFFEASPTPYLILLPDAPNFTIVAVNDAYIKSTGLQREDITGLSIFSVFSDNQPLHITQGIKLLRSSLLHVMQHKKAHAIPVERLEMAVLGRDKQFVRYWNPANVPLMEDGEIKYIAHSITDITDAILEQQKTHKDNEHFRNLVEHAHVAIALYTGREMKIQLANRAMIKLWGKDSSVIGNTIRQALPELEGQPFHELLDNVYTSGETYHASEDRCDLVVNGRLQTFYFNFTYKPLHDSRGAIYGILNMAVDVTEQVLNRRKIELGHERFRALSAELEERVLERTRELEEANASMARSNQELEQFAYVASHDLQEPLRKIRAFGDILQARYKEELSNEGGELIDRMQSATDRMKALIEDLLAFSRVSSNTRFKKDVDLDTVIQGVISDLYAAIHERKAKILVDGLLPITGDAMQFRQLFQNLLSNSLKFASTDRIPQITITGKKVKGNESGFKLTRNEARKNYLLIEVRDNGIGFEQQYSERIFQIFQRLHGNATHPGSGIGLSIVKKVVDNHYGYIKATSEPGDGAVFYILLPL